MKIQSNPVGYSEKNSLKRTVYILTLSELACSVGKQFKAFLWILFLVPSLACLDSSANIDYVDGAKVLNHVKRIVSFGPHPPGSEAQKQVGAYITDQLELYELQVQRHTFEVITPIGRLEMTNIWGIIPGEKEEILILASHYDSKYFEDFVFVGANDSGSSSALLLELARLLSRNNPIPYPLWLVFFDGEEAFQTWTSADSLYGSREFVKMLHGRNQINLTLAMILLDMVGEKDLIIRQDINSTDWLNKIIWETAAELGNQNIFSIRGNTGAVDDHIPFREAGIPAVDVIDLDYEHWHRPEDTLDKLSQKNMSIVGNVIYSSLRKISSHLTENP